MYEEYFKDILVLDKDIKGFIYEDKEYCLTEGIVKLCTEKYKNKLLNRLKENEDKREYNVLYGYNVYIMHSIELHNGVYAFIICKMYYMHIKNL